jgi:CBS domain-containing protein
VTTTGKAAEADVAYIDAGKTLRQAGHLMRELGVGTLVVRAENGEVRGTISRDMVVQRIAAGGDPKTVTVGEVASAGRAHRRAPARSARAPVTRHHHACDPGGRQLNWEEIGLGPAWSGTGMTADEFTGVTALARNTPGLVA